MLLKMVPAMLGIAIGLGGYYSYKYWKTQQELAGLKVGDCYENTLTMPPACKGCDKTDYMMEKIIKIYPKQKEIETVYTFPYNPGFEWGQWYQIKALATESIGPFKYWRRKVECLF
jgi:hypothetical protein